MKFVIVAVLAIGFLSGCSSMQLVIQPPVPLEQKQDYRQEYTYGGKDAFYYKSYLLVVNASQYWVRVVKNGTELPIAYQPKSELEIAATNVLYKDVRMHVLVVAYDRNDRVMGTAEKTFSFSGTGQQQVEQWVLKDWMFR